MRDVFRDRATLGKFTAVLGLHMGQMFPAAFFGLMLTAIYREKGLPLDMFWIFVLPSIPTWLRPLWAPFVDGVGSSRIGLRKTWFIPCTLFGAAAYLSLALFEPEIATLWIIIGILIVKTTFMTTQDIAIDGYMVENLRDEERGVGAAVMDIGRNVAQFSSWAGVAWVYGTYGWPAAVVTAASLLILFSLPGIIRREPPPPPQAQRRRDRGEHPSLIKLFRRPDTRIILPLVMLVSFGGGLISSLVHRLSRRRRLHGEADRSVDTRAGDAARHGNRRDADRVVPEPLRLQDDDPRVGIPDDPDGDSDHLDGLDREAEPADGVPRDAERHHPAVVPDDRDGGITPEVVVEDTSGHRLHVVRRRGDRRGVPHRSASAA